MCVSGRGNFREVVEVTEKPRLVSESQANNSEVILRLFGAYCKVCLFFKYLFILERRHANRGRDRQRPRESPKETTHWVWSLIPGISQL